MRPGVVIVLEVISQHALQVPLVQDNEVIQTLAANRTDIAPSSIQTNRRAFRQAQQRQSVNHCRDQPARCGGPRQAIGGRAGWCVYVARNATHRGPVAQRAGGEVGCESGRSPRENAFHAFHQTGMRFMGGGGSRETHFAVAAAEMGVRVASPSVAAAVSPPRSEHPTKRLASGLAESLTVLGRWAVPRQGSEVAGKAIRPSKKKYGTSARLRRLIVQAPCAEICR